MRRAQVVIAGAGPVGTFAGYCLAQAGIDTIILEAQATCMMDLRASTFHPSTLEMLDELGIANDLIAQGLKAPVYQYRDRVSNDVFEFDLGNLADMTKFPFRLQCEQYKLSNMLVDLLEAHDHASIEFRKRVTYVSQDSDRVKVLVEAPFGIETIEADFLIAADGANSIVRKFLAIQFEGFTYPEKFLCWSTDWPIEQYFDGLSLVNYVADPDQWCVLLRAPSAWRILVSAPDETPDDILLGDAHKDAAFRQIFGTSEEIETKHRTIYRVHQRVAESYVDNRIVLVGDAAHLNNPLGGLGMNSGIHDARNLCGKLVQILQEGRDRTELLGIYDRQRRSVTKKFIQQQTMRNKQAMENRDAQSRERYNSDLRAILNDPEKLRGHLLNQALFTSLRDAAAVT